MCSEAKKRVLCVMRSLVAYSFSNTFVCFTVGPLVHVLENLQGWEIHGWGGCIIVLYVLCIIFVLIQKIHGPFKGKYAPRYSKYKRSGSNMHSNLYMRGPLDLIVATIISDEDSALTSRASGYICVVFIAAPLFSYFWCDPHP